MGVSGDSSATFDHLDELGEAVIRFGLCCTFREAPIKFANTTATSVSRLDRPDALAKLSRLSMANADALLASLHYCAAQGIGCFRVNSQILPLKTHPVLGYEIEDLPESDEIVRRFQACGDFAQKHGLRTSFHPDQFVVLNSKRPEVVNQSIREIEYQAEVAEWIGADVINLHGGGAFGNKQKALSEFAKCLRRLPARARTRLTVENDDKIYTPADLLPICRTSGIPFVYDVHHHRCNPDGLSIEQATEEALSTWNREPLFHISSPQNGWAGPKPERHHEFIDVEDFPRPWRKLNITVEVEARAKEAAVSKLKYELESHPNSKARRGNS
jgi:UV DNA damage endonuclease